MTQLLLFQNRGLRGGGHATGGPDHAIFYGEFQFPIVC